MQEEDTLFKNHEAFFHDHGLPGSAGCWCSTVKRSLTSSRDRFSLKLSDENNMATSYKGIYFSQQLWFSMVLTDDKYQSVQAYLLEVLLEVTDSNL